MAEATTPCPKCGGPRFVYQGKSQKHSRCRPCEAAKARSYYHKNRAARLAAAKAWRAANPDKVRVCNANWREKNPGRVDEINRAYYEANREAEIARSLAYTRANPDVDRAIKHRREARKRDAVCEHGSGCVNAAFMAAIRASRCRYCDEPAAQADHFHPLSKGGLHCRSNIVPACRSCNARKRDRLPAEWLALLATESHLASP